MFMALLCPAALEQKAPCSMTTPFGVPVLTDVNMTYAALSGRTSEDTKGPAGSDARNDDESSTTIPTIPSNIAAVWGDTIMTLAPTWWIISSLRLAGCEGSNGTKAPPAFNTASIATIVHTDFSKHSGT